MATQNNNITKVEVSVIDVNDQQPQFDPDSLIAAVAEEAEFDTTVTVLKVSALSPSLPTLLHYLPSHTHFSSFLTPLSCSSQCYYVCVKVVKSASFYRQQTAITIRHSAQCTMR